MKEPRKIKNQTRSMNKSYCPEQVFPIQIIVSESSSHTN